MTTYSVYQLLSMNKLKCSEEFVKLDDGRTWNLQMPALISKDTADS